MIGPTLKFFPHSLRSISPPLNGQAYPYTIEIWHALTLIMYFILINGYGPPSIYKALCSTVISKAL